MKPKYRPPLPEAFKAKCCECCAYYSDGRWSDCQINGCPMYFHMPYRQGNPDYSWVFGKWTSKYKKQQLALGLTEEQFIKQHIIKPNGKPSIGRVAMIRAKCYRCNCDFVDRRQDCQIPNCTIYYWMPYREMEPNFDWIFNSPYTKKHNIRRMAEGLTRDEYLDTYLSNSTVEKKEDSPIVQVRFRGVARGRGK